MAKITITIEDKPNGGVMVACDPSVEEMAKIQKYGGLTSAHDYAFALLNAARLKSEINRRLSSPIILPRGL